MQVTSLFLSSDFLLRKIAKRNLKRVNEYTSISEKLSPELSKPLKNNIDSIARFAEKENCNLEFVPGTDLFQNSAEVNVYKRNYKIIEDKKGYPSFVLSNKTLSGKAFLPDPTTDKKTFIDNIKSQVKIIIANDKNWNNKYSK